MDKCDYVTEVQSVRDIIRTFLELPPEALPSAAFTDDDEPGSAWDAIEAYMTDSSAGLGREVRLRASRSPWQDGIHVTLS